MPKALYIATTYNDKDICCADAFYEAVVITRRTHDDPAHTFNFAVRVNGQIVQYIPRSDYAFPVPTTFSEAIHFIWERNRSIERAEQRGATPREISLLKLQGMERCNYYDSMREQVQQFFLSAPWEWKTSEKLLELSMALNKKYRPSGTCQVCGKPYEKHQYSYDMSVPMKGANVPLMRRLCNGDYVA